MKHNNLCGKLKKCFGSLLSSDEKQPKDMECRSTIAEILMTSYKAYEIVVKRMQPYTITENIILLHVKKVKSIFDDMSSDNQSRVHEKLGVFALQLNKSTEKSKK